MQKKKHPKDPPPPKRACFKTVRCTGVKKEKEKEKTRNMVVNRSRLHILYGSFSGCSLFALWPPNYFHPWTSQAEVAQNPKEPWKRRNDQKNKKQERRGCLHARDHSETLHVQVCARFFPCTCNVAARIRYVVLKTWLQA